MKVLVCGGREFDDFTMLCDAMDAIDAKRRIKTVIHGAACGADSLAGSWAHARGCKVQMFPADWKKDGKAAGPIRNQRMLDEGKPDMVVAFPGGRGTADMVRRARAAGIEVMEVKSNG